MRAMTERADRLRAELAVLRDRQTYLGRVNAIFLEVGDRVELANLCARIATLEQAIAEADSLSLTGDGTERP